MRFQNIPSGCPKLTKVFVDVEQRDSYYILQMYSTAINGGTNIYVKIRTIIKGQYSEGSVYKVWISTFWNLSGVKTSQLRRTIIKDLLFYARHIGKGEQWKILN
jgi:hypothetical protein